MPEITEYKTGDKIKCKRTFDNLGVRYTKGEEFKIFDDGEETDICEVRCPEGFIVTMDKDCLKNFDKL